VYTQRLKRYEKSIRKERTKKAKQNSATLVSDVRSDHFLHFLFRLTKFNRGTTHAQSIDMQLLQTSFDEWRAQMMEDLTVPLPFLSVRFAFRFSLSFFELHFKDHAISTNQECSDQY
jgi:hypothetical protein